MFRGTLDDFTLPEILRMLAFSKKSGTLNVSRRAGTGSIVFSKGSVVYAETELSSSRLGQKLVGAGKISASQLRRSLDVQATSGERLGRILLAAAAVTKEDVETAVRSQVEEAAYELMCWEAGEFSWEPGAPEADPEISLDIEELMSEVEARLTERAEMQRRLAIPGAVPRMVEHAPHGPGNINIHPHQWRVLVLVNGRRTVDDLAAAAGLGTEEVVKTLHDLASAGLVEVREDAPAEAVESETPIASEPASGQNTAFTRGVPERNPAPRPDPVAAAFAVTPAAGSHLAETQRSAEPPEEWFKDPDVPAGSDGISVAFPPPEPAVEDLPRVDRAAAVRELSGLFDDPKTAPKPPPPRRPGDPKEEDPKGLRQRLTRRPSP